MILYISHQTTYTYSEKVVPGMHYKHFHPQNRPYLKVRDFHLEVQPNPSLLSARLVPENNVYHQVWMNQEVHKLHITASAVLDVKTFNPFDFIVDINGPHSSAEYLRQNQEYFRPFIEEMELPERMQDFSREVADNNPVSFCSNLAREIHESWIHELRPEHGILTPVECYDRKAGSCRDLTRMAIAILRNQGFPCRYVGGYCFVPQLEDGHELHAWLEIYLPGSGWLGVDPSLGLLTSEHHIPVASSFEPSRTLPVQGFYHGDASSEMTAKITISKEE